MSNNDSNKKDIRTRFALLPYNIVNDQFAFHLLPRLFDLFTPVAKCAMRDSKLIVEPIEVKAIKEKT
jgi:hypothetical protein